MVKIEEALVANPDFVWATCFTVYPNDIVFKHRTISVVVVLRLCINFSPCITQAGTNMATIHQ